MRATTSSDICLLGAFCVGKTSLVRRFVLDQFSDAYHATIGVDLVSRRLTVDGAPMELRIHDIAGAENRFSVPSHYVQGTAGFILAIDGARDETLDRGLDLVRQIDRDLGRLPRVAVINKCDLSEGWKVDDGWLGRLADLGCPIYRTSAKTGHNVQNAFAALASQLPKKDRR